MGKYYAIRDKRTGFYFRGKGVYRWGRYFNRASIYISEGTAMATMRDIAWRKCEEPEIVPLQIVVTADDVVPAEKVAEMLRLIFIDDCACNYNGNDEWLPLVCKYADTDECPMPSERLACWKEFVKHFLEKMDGRGDDE